ncbi:hypothetical protein Daesc_001861 [Daldinia eschscholtzii]|uniref:Uncharacterized protein n=1 Tax=Daldinia eschscholtzii TaxID=292717 RepID=A0AAX6MVX7_9PEZI
MQASLPQDLVPVRASTLLAIISSSCAISDVISEIVFQQRLRANLRGVVSSDVIGRIISVSATATASVVSAEQLQPAIQQCIKLITQIRGSGHIPHVGCWVFAGLDEEWKESSLNQQKKGAS